MKSNNGIIKPEDLPEKEVVYLKKGFKGWGVVYPIKNEDGTMNWFNIITGGSWWNWIITGVIVLMLLGVLYEYSSNMNHFLNCFTGPVELEACKSMYIVKDTVANTALWRG